MSECPPRSMLRYHGGKWKLANWIIGHLPEHRVYVEPFGGAASVLLKKPRSDSEVYNDLDSEVVNLFRVVRDRGEELRHVLELTPFAREEFELAYEPANDSLERARRMVVRAGMGRDPASSTATKRATFRCYTGDKRRPTTQDWCNYTDALESLTNRLRGVVIEHRDAVQVMQAHDGAQTVHYVDPPYVVSTRDKGMDYRHEMTDTDHERLAEALHRLKGRVVLSGYDSALYTRLYGDWAQVQKVAHADGAQQRTEVLWLSKP